MKQFMALPLLKPNEIRIAFEGLKSLINEIDDMDFKAKVCLLYYVKICNYCTC